MMTTAIKLGLAIACGAVATQAPQPGARPLDVRTLERLDQSRQDMGPLRASLLWQPTDLRQPLGFDSVYRLPSRNGVERLARFSGGLTAVFPRSEYVETRDGVFATVPAGTVFYIGPLLEEAPARAPRARPEASEASRANGAAASQTSHEAVRGLDTRAATAPPPALVATPDRRGHIPGIMTDEAYRARRVRELLVEAAAARRPEAGAREP